LAKVKLLLRKAGGRTREALLEPRGKALDAVSTSDARGFFEHRRYCPTAKASRREGAGNDVPTPVLD
jgi:hypothetical protein